MNWIFLVLFLAGFYPWCRAGLALRGTSLAHAWLWAVLAWIGWGVGQAIAPDFSIDGQAGKPDLRYLALCLTACAGVAVLGARRPHVVAWNFVVLGLLAIMTLPLLEALFLHQRQPGVVRILFLSATLAVITVNYLPTRLGPAALMGGIGIAVELLALVQPGRIPASTLLATRLGLFLIPWVGLACWHGLHGPGEALQRDWLQFRDRYGAVWALRVREQFHLSARNQGLPVHLGWNGVLHSSTELSAEARVLLSTDLRALLKRFL